MRGWSPSACSQRADSGPCSMRENVAAGTREARCRVVRQVQKAHQSQARERRERAENARVVVQCADVPNKREGADGVRPCLRPHRPDPMPEVVLDPGAAKQQRSRIHLDVHRRGEFVNRNLPPLSATVFSAARPTSLSNRPTDGPSTSR